MAGLRLDNELLCVVIDTYMYGVVQVVLCVEVIGRSTEYGVDSFFLFKNIWIAAYLHSCI